MILAIKAMWMPMIRLMASPVAGTAPCWRKVNVLKTMRTVQVKMDAAVKVISATSKMNTGRTAIKAASVG